MFSQRSWIWRLPWEWGDVASSPAPMGRELFPDAVDLRVATRARRIAAPPDVVFLWLCQLRRAPYSYDWIDNLGRRSPRQADPRLQQLELGQRVMAIFHLVDFCADSMTIRMNHRFTRALFGEVAVRYEVDPLPWGQSRLTARMWMPTSAGRLARMRRYLLAWADVIMMRKQLHTLAALAAAEASRDR